MSLITGYLKQLVGTPGNDQVTIRAAVFPVVVGGALILPETKVVRANDLGFWQCFLVQGYYDISVLAANGQTAKVTINVPNDSLTYSFDQLIVSSLPVLSPPTNGVVPTASPSQLGLAKVDAAVAQPIAVTGFFLRTNYAAARALPNLQNNKLLFVTDTDEWFKWSSASGATDDNEKILKPNDTTVGNPGRWVRSGVITPTGSLSGSGSPDGVVTALAGWTYWDFTNGVLWVNDDGATDWIELIALAGYVAGVGLGGEGGLPMAGSGSPDGAVVALRGTLYWDFTNGVLWVNDDGITTWKELLTVAGFVAGVGLGGNADVPLASGGTPEGVLEAIRGTPHWDQTNKIFRMKNSYSGNTGWIELIAA